MGSARLFVPITDVFINEMTPNGGLKIKFENIGPHIMVLIVCSSLRLLEMSQVTFLLFLQFSEFHHFDNNPKQLKMVDTR